MDRSDDFLGACQHVAADLNHNAVYSSWNPSASVLPELSERSPYTQAAYKLHAHITTILTFIDDHRKDYLLPGRCSESDKDSFEAQVAQLMGACSQGIERLRNSLQGVRAGSDSGLNAAQIAHCHGMALILATLLSAAADTFQQLQASRQSSSSRAAAASSARGTSGNSGTTPRPDLKALLRRERAAASAAAAAATDAAADHGGGDSAGAGVGRGYGGGEKQGGQQAQVEGPQLTAQQLALVEDLAEMGDQTRGLEATMHEVAALNRAFASHLLGQNEQIEALYNNAVAASTNLDLGNVQLKKTTVVNKSAGWGMFWILVCAGLLLLFFDWRAG